MRAAAVVATHSHVHGHDVVGCTGCQAHILRGPEDRVTESLIGSSKVEQVVQLTDSPDGDSVKANGMPSNTAAFQRKKPEILIKDR
jgi:hypothetical protein